MSTCHSRHVRYVGFWIIKIAATTLGETGGDTVTMTLGWGYLAGTACFLPALIVLVTARILASWGLDVFLPMPPNPDIFVATVGRPLVTRDDNREVELPPGASE
jgi:hypothetical protein